MLMTIRDKAQGWIAWAIVILISIPFALWGIQEYLGVGSEPLIAKVNDREITEREVETAAFKLRNNLREQLGAQYNADLFPESLLRKQVLEGMIEDTLIQQASDRLGLRAGDSMVRETILTVPAFQVNGQFDTEVYKRAVQLQGLTEKGFEERIRNSLVTTQLRLAIEGSAAVPKPFVEDADQLSRQQRKFSYVIVSTDQIAPPAEPTEEEIETYYSSNQNALMSDEMVKLEYVLLNYDAIANTLDATEDNLRAFYEQHKSEFVIPDKKRISHILFELDSEADEQTVKAVTEKAENIFRRAQQGEDFATLAGEVSQDIVSAEQGGDLGYLEPGLFDQDFENAASALSLDEISEPVRTRFGLHLIKVTAVDKGNDADFDSVRDQVKEKFLQSESEQVFYDFAERLGNLSYESPDSLEPAAQELGLEIQATDWISRSGGEGVLSSPKVTGAAFSEEALTQGYNSEPIELSPSEIIVLRVVEHKVAAVKPLEEVKTQIIEQLKSDAAATAVESKADELLAELKSGTSIQAIADANAMSVENVDYSSRKNPELPGGLLDKVFAMPKPSEGVSEYAKSIMSADEIALILLDDVKQVELNEDNSMLMNMLSQQQGGEEFQSYINSLRAAADIEYLKKL
jgi:peptidyl-prolyl cis-trans isomerase D